MNKEAEAINKEKAEIKRIMQNCNKFNIRGIFEETIESYFNNLA